MPAGVSWTVGFALNNPADQFGDHLGRNAVLLFRFHGLHALRKCCVIGRGGIRGDGSYPASRKSGLDIAGFDEYNTDSQFSDFVTQALRKALHSELTGGIEALEGKAEQAA